MIRKHVVFFLVLSDARMARPCIYIVQRDNRRYWPQPSVVAVVVKTNNDVVQVKYTNQMCCSCMGMAQKVPSGRKGRETYMLLTGSNPCAKQKGAGPTDRMVFLLPDQIKRDKGVWWMPWQ
jgi:hypothetical protein